MANAFTIWATLGLDTSEFEQGLDKSKNTLSKTARELPGKLSSLTVATGTLLAGALSKAANGLVQLGKQALNATGELEQNLGGSEAVWGSWADNIQGVAARAFKTMGLSQSDYLAEANKMGSLLKGSGYTTAEAYELTTEVMQRASDVASIMGIDVSSAMQAIEGAAKGNFTMMDNLGVSINETALNAYALEKGLAQGTKGMTSQQKTGLAFQMFLEKTADYTGNYAKENDTLAGSLTTVGAAWENFLSGAGEDPAGDLAESVANAAQVVMKNVGEMVPRLATGATQVIQKLAPMVKDWLANVDFKELGSKLGEGLKNFITNLPQTLSAIGSAISTGWETIVWPTIQGLFSAAFGIELPDWGGVVDSISAWWDNVKTSISSWFSAVFSIFTEDQDGQSVAERISAWWGKVQESIGDVFRALFGVDMPDWNTIGQAISTGWTETVWPAIQGLFSAVFGVDLPDWATIVQAISDGWTGTVWPGIQGFFQETFGLSLPDWNGVVNDISGWWENVKASISGYFSAVFSIFTEDEDGQSVAARISSWWFSVMDAVGNVFNAMFGISLPSASQIKEQIQTWWQSIKNSLSLSLGISVSNPTAVHTTESGEEVGGGVRGSFASGLNYVPYNDYLAYLHKGEAVLTEQNAAEWRAGNNGGSAQIDYDRLSSAFASALSGALVQMDGREVGQLVLPTVSREIGWDIRRRP